MERELCLSVPAMLGDTDLGIVVVCLSGAPGGSSSPMIPAIALDLRSSLPLMICRAVATRDGLRPAGDNDSMARDLTALVAVEID